MKLIDILRVLEEGEVIRISELKSGDYEDILTGWIYPMEVGNYLYNRKVVKMGIYKARTVEDLICNGGLWVTLDKED